MRRRKKLILRLITLISIMTIGVNYMKLGADKSEIELLMGYRNNYLFEQTMKSLNSNGIIWYHGLVILP